MPEIPHVEREARRADWMFVTLALLDPFQYATDRAGARPCHNPQQLADRERDEIDAMHNEGNPNHNDDDETEKHYRPDCYLDPVYERYNSFRQ
jgi:hypothetical protein